MAYAKYPVNVRLLTTHKDSYILSVFGRKGYMLTWDMWPRASLYYILVLGAIDHVLEIVLDAPE